MIHLAAFWLAVLPPVLAIFVEFFNPINARVVRANADRDLRADFAGLTNADRNELLGMLERSGAAIAEISGLAPTLIASTTSGFAVIHELSSPFWPAVVYVLIFVLVALYLLWLLSGLTFDQIGGRNAAVPLPLTSRELAVPIKRTSVVSLTIYVANGALIVLAIFVFAGKQELGAKPTGAEGNLGAIAFEVAEEAKGLRDALRGQLMAAEKSQSRFDELQRRADRAEDEINKLREQVKPLLSSPASEEFLGQLGWQRIQIALRRSRFEPGPLDGIPGRRTRQAITRFQSTQRPGAVLDGTLTNDDIAKLWPLGNPP